jgi:hypothetical protein
MGSVAFRDRQAMNNILRVRRKRMPLKGGCPRVDNAYGGFCLPSKSRRVVVQENFSHPDAASGQQNEDRRLALPDYVVDQERRLVFVKFRKKVTVDAIAEYAAALRAHPLFDPHFSEIVNLSEVEELDLQADEFIRLADEVDPFSLQAKRAFVVRNAVQSHAARMHKILRTQRNFEIFRSVGEAERWIGS